MDQRDSVPCTDVLECLSPGGDGNKQRNPQQENMKKVRDLGV